MVARIVAGEKNLWESQGKGKGRQEDSGGVPTVLWEGTRLGLCFLRTIRKISWVVGKKEHSSIPRWSNSSRQYDIVGMPLTKSDPAVSHSLPQARKAHFVHYDSYSISHARSCP